MSTLIFDIETVGEDYEALDDTTKAVLTRWAQKTAKTDEEYSLLEVDIKSSLGFSPLTGFVVAIGVYDLERARGVVYYTGVEGERDIEDGDFIFKERSEEVMLREFWDGAAKYDTFVTFNGRAFDAPFLMHRSAANHIKPTKNLLEGRYAYQQKGCRHVDLQDELTFYGAMQRRPSLHLFCRAFGIVSPKGEVSGDDVASLFADKQFTNIARYNAQDVMATTALYKKWLEYYDFSGKEPDNIDF